MFLTTFQGMLSWWEAGFVVTSPVFLASRMLTLLMGAGGLCCCLSFMFALVTSIEFVFALASLPGFCSERLVITGLNNPW